MHALLNNIQRKAASQALAKRTIVLCRNKLDEKIYVDKSYKYAIKRKLRQNVTLEQVWADIKNFYEFLKFFDDFDTFITYRVLLEVHFIYTNTHKNYYYNFFLEFWNWNYNKNFVPLFLFSYNNPPHFCELLWPTSLCSKCPWVGINAVYSFYRWLFSWLLV